MGNHIVSIHQKKRCAQGINLNGSNRSATRRRYPRLSPPLHPPTFQRHRPRHPYLHVLSIPWLHPLFNSKPAHHKHSSYCHTKTRLPKVGLLSTQNWISFPTVRGCNDTAFSWSTGTHHKDHWKVAIRCLPHLLTGPDCHFHSRCCRSHGKSALVQTHHCT